jgi:hypothetical protein
MTLQAEVGYDEQSLLDYSELRSQRAWSGVTKRESSVVRGCRN